MVNLELDYAHFSFDESSSILTFESNFDLQYPSRNSLITLINNFELLESSLERKNFRDLFEITKDRKLHDIVHYYYEARGYEAGIDDFITTELINLENIDDSRDYLLNFMFSRLVTNPQDFKSFRDIVVITHKKVLNYDLSRLIKGCSQICDVLDTREKVFKIWFETLFKLGN